MIFSQPIVYEFPLLTMDTVLMIGGADTTAMKHSRAAHSYGLLPKWASPQIPVFAVYSNRKFLPMRLTVFLEALTAWTSPLWLRE